MTPDEQRDVHEVCDISDRAFVDAIELLHLIEVMQSQNKDHINAKLSAEGAAGAAHAVRNGLLSRIVLFLAGAYAVPRPGDLHLRRAFDLLQQPAVRAEFELRGSSNDLAEAIRLWAECRGNHSLPKIKHFRDKFTAHLSTPTDDIALPSYEDIFVFARETMRVIEALALGTGARTEPLSDWQPAAAQAADRFWSVRK
jgi:AbiU2